MKLFIALGLLFGLIPFSDARCSRREFECDDGECIDAEGFCDEIIDCFDESDERHFHITSPDTEGIGIACRNEFSDDVCILPHAQERNKRSFCKRDICEDGEFRCADGTQCIQISQFCDGGTTNCRDGSDEVTYDPAVHNGTDGISCRHQSVTDRVCLLPTIEISKKEQLCKENAECAEDEYTCADGKQCIPKDKFCSDEAYCKDGSDRILYSKLENKTGWVPCRQKNLTDICWLPENQTTMTDICDGDEMCTKDEFRCSDGSGCIPKSKFCHGIKTECRDGSDVELYNSTAHTSEDGIPCRNEDDTFICLLPKDQEFKKAELCTGNSDCEQNEYRCQDHSECIFIERFCDGTIHCSDGSDEFAHNSSIHTTRDGIMCRHETDLKTFCLLPNHQVEKAVNVCRTDKDDEECLKSGFICADGKSCIKDYLFCSGATNCRDQSDEDLYDESIHDPSDGVKCQSLLLPGRNCLLPASQAEKDKFLCNIEESTCRADMHSCKDKMQCILDEQFCDGTPQCKDSSDETLYTKEYNQSHTGGVSCKREQADGLQTCFLPREKVCDGRKDCIGGNDECLCGREALIDDDCFQCLSGSQIIKMGQVCDGVIDCKDFSDECLCHYGMGVSSKLCDNVNWEFGDDCAGQLSCAANATECLERKSVCDDVKDCESGIDQRFCDKEKGYNGKRNGKCLGDPTLTSIVFECRTCKTSVRPGFCNFTRDMTSGTDTFFTFVCLSGERIPPHSVCNGVVDCKEKEDELHCPTRFNCRSGSRVNVRMEKKCDLAKDCEDASDEADCEESTRLCDNPREDLNGSGICATHFYCNDGGLKKYIDSRKVCDGNFDCASGIDECQERCIESVFSSAKSLISSKGILVIIWIISMIALFGNFFVIIFTAKKVFWPKHSLAAREKGQEILVLNLAFADFLVGVYTASICIQNEVLSGGQGYCKKDQSWRSSGGCNFLGVLLVLGSEASVMALTIITAFRLRAVMKPFNTVHEWWYWACLALAWILTLILALVPLAATAKDYFRDYIWYQHNPLFSTIRRENLSDLSEKLLIMQGKDGNYVDEHGSVGSWSLLESLIADLNPEYVPERTFGYYSAHGVCLPRLFADRDNFPAWGYSFLIIFLNFLSFVFIFIGYVIIFRRATTCKVTKSAGNTDRVVALQRKVTRIVATDFLCWMPVCIMVILQVAGVKISEDVYVPVGMILIPINSALNPFLYSDFPEWVWSFVGPYFPCYKTKEGDDSTQNGTSRTGNITQTSRASIPNDQSKSSALDCSRVRERLVSSSYEANSTAQTKSQMEMKELRSKSIPETSKMLEEAEEGR